LDQHRGPDAAADRPANMSAAAEKGRMPAQHDVPSHDQPLPRGDRNMNPCDIGFFDLLREDYRTHDRHFFEPGFLAIAVHRFGNVRMGVRFKLLRAPLTLLYRMLYTMVNWTWGIDLPYTTRLGRRVRIWHHGGMVLGARSIGDDVHIRHNTTFGVLNRQQLTSKPIIGNRVDIGTGACVFGAVTVGDDSVIGANSVVLRDVPPGSVFMGNPARPANFSVAPGRSADGKKN
jgi:serine O-acetyltransferase